MVMFRSFYVFIVILMFGPCCNGDRKIQLMRSGHMTKEDYADGEKRAKVIAGQQKPFLEAELKKQGVSWGAPVFIRLFKEERVLELWVKDKTKYKLFRSYPIAAMSGGLGAKTREGDKQAPEGFYYIPSGRMKPDSSYHLAFNIGYPNQYDVVHERTGSLIMVHGAQLSIGCFAMTDEKIEEIYTLCDAALKNGQPFFRLHSFPFRMKKKRMLEEVSNPWYDFWLNLQEGYHLFEQHKWPPNVEVDNKRYVFSY